MTMFGSRKKWFVAGFENVKFGCTTAWELLAPARGDVRVCNSRGRVLAEFWGL